ncbi:predicted nucleic acid-binding protein [Hoeflea halophila]|uniref:Predicted nucleic acid-binding protein n=1 Tax=Hoeflea halophila TaxID=714899 RepID=A0A286I9R3_9HYPH|nr:PIN domain-containing protein [Hoeflea halophila]SOE16801.1 predicted nucleic acid-binding protein [Hoeflea halophila]
MNAAFFDTNIVAYAAHSTAADATKRDLARRLMQTREVTTSTQVMMELYQVLRRKLAYGAEAAMQWIQTLQNDNVVAVSPVDVVRAMEISHRHSISHWDGLILVAAQRADLEIVYSEDLNHGQAYGSVRVCNPFLEDFLA